MIYLFKLFRPINLLLILFTQICAVYFLGFGNDINDLFDYLHLSIYFSTLFTATAGYLFNNIKDIKTDEINHSTSKINLMKNNKTLFLLTYIFLSIVALLIAFVYSLKLGVIVLILHFLLFLYNILLKKIPLIGNILISAITAFSIFIFVIFDANIKINLVIIFTIYAFGISLIREIIKDAEDIEGDTHTGRYTFPVLAGIKATRILLLILIFFYVLVITTCVRIMTEKYFSFPLSSVFIIYNIICIGIPIFYLSLKTQYATHKSDFEYMSRIAKYIMFTGVLSMLFF